MSIDDKKAQASPIAKIIAVLLALAIIVAAIGFVVNFTQSQKTTTANPDNPYDTSNLDYEELFPKRNTEESLLKLVVSNPDGDSNPIVRIYPTVNDQTFVGKIKPESEIYVSKAWIIEGETNNKTWIGVLYNDISSELQELNSTEQIDSLTNQNSIVWINGYYAGVYCREKDPGMYDDMDYKVYIYDEGEFSITVEDDCRLRSAPETGTDANVYGEFIGATLNTTVIYKNSTNKFYGVPVDVIKNSILKHRVGDVKEDPDGIVWFSTAYAKIA